MKAKYEFEAGNHDIKLFKSLDNLVSRMGVKYRY